MESGTRARAAPLRDDGERPPQPPANTAAEQALLGAILVNPIAYSRVSDFILPEHFSEAVHGRIYSAIQTLIERGDPANPVTLRRLFDQDGALADIGGAQYLARLAESAVSILNAPSYGRTILDLHQRRALIAIGQDIVTRAYTADLGDPAERQVEAAETALAGVALGHGGKSDAIGSAADAAMASIRRSEDAYRQGTAAGISTGLAALDRLTGGLQRGDLVYVGGRPSQGKTAACVTMMLGAAAAGLRVAFWSAEMSSLRIGRRLLAALTGIPARNQAAGELTSDDWTRLTAAQRQLEGYPITIDDTASIGVGTLRRRAKQLQRKGLDLIVIDYLQLLRVGDGREDVALRDSVPKVSGALRDLARELDVPVVVMSQLGRDVERRDDKRPMLSDLRWGGELDQDAAVVMMLYRDEYYLQRAEPRAGVSDDPLKADKLHAQWSQALAHSRGRAEILVVKARDDDTGTAHVAFDGARSLFTDLTETQGRMF